MRIQPEEEHFGYITWLEYKLQINQDAQLMANCRRCVNQINYTMLPIFVESWQSTAIKPE